MDVAEVGGAQGDDGLGRTVDEQRALHQFFFSFVTELKQFEPANES